MANTFKNARAVIQTTTTTAYTCPAATRAIVIGCQVANVSATTEKVSVWWTDDSNSDAITRLVKDLALAVGTAVGVIDGKLVLEAGDTISASGETNNDAEISVSVLEIS